LERFLGEEMKGGEREEAIYHRWRFSSLNLQPEPHFMPDFFGPSKAHLAVVTHQNMRRRRIIGIPNLETAVLPATSVTKKG
jgi:hypothetical protein